MAIYLDQAATSFPKPPQVPAQMVHYLTHVGATVNRASYAPAQEAAMTALSLRERLCRLLGCEAAVLKERSPSCGRGQIYDGTFSGTLTAGDGVTAELLTANGIPVYGESQIETLLK